MSECTLNKMVSINKVVNAAMVDTYAEIGKTKERYLHWAARGVKKLNRESLKVGKRKVLINVHPNTKTAVLPPDFGSETFVGVIDSMGYKIAMKLKNDLTNESSITEIECEDKCSKCNQDKAICEDMEVSETTETVVINGQSAVVTVLKKLYPDGRYYLETTSPYWNTVTEAIEYATIKEFISELDLKPCGCLETTEENLQKIKNCNIDVYNCYFAPCSNVCNQNIGGYKVFEETGMLQLDYHFPFDKVYIEYMGTMPKINGQYAIPEVAFETLVQFVKFKAVENRSNITVHERTWYFQNYLRERGNMMKNMTKVSLSQIINAVRRLPRFEIDWSSDCPTTCKPTTSPYVSQITSSDCSANVIAATECCDKKILTPFQLAVEAGMGEGTPVLGLTTYQNNELIGAVNLNFIIVDNNIESAISGSFTFDAVTGTIDRSPNIWVEENRLIAPFAKFI